MKITARGQVTVPIEIRRKMGLLPNTEVEFVVSGRKVILRKMRDRRRRGSRLITAMRDRSTKKLSTDEIMALTRGD